MATTSILATAGTFAVEPFAMPTSQSDWRAGVLVTRAVNGNLGDRARRMFRLSWPMAPALAARALRAHYAANVNAPVDLDVPTTGVVKAMWWRPPRISMVVPGSVSMEAQLVEALITDT